MNFILTFFGFFVISFLILFLFSGCEEESIKSEEYYYYELRIPQKYYQMLVAFQDSNFRGPNRHDFSDPYEKTYKQAPFLSIFYLHDLSKRLLI